MMCQGRIEEPPSRSAERQTLHHLGGELSSFLEHQAGRLKNSCITKALFLRILPLTISYYRLFLKEKKNITVSRIRLMLMCISMEEELVTKTNRFKNRFFGTGSTGQPANIGKENSLFECVSCQRKGVGAGDKSDAKRIWFYFLLFVPFKSLGQFLQ
jgi:hypothetical protein